MSSAGCPGSPRGCPRPPHIQNEPGHPPALTPTHGAWCPTCQACPRRRPAASTRREPRPPSAGSSARCTSPPRRTRWRNPFRGVPLAERADNFAANLTLLTGQAGQDQAERDTVLRVWDAALADPGYDGSPVWRHGDLSVAWMLLPPGCHASFWSAYQATGGRPATPCRGWALNLAIVF